MAPGEAYAGPDPEALPQELIGLTITVRASCGKFWSAIVERSLQRILARTRRLGTPGRDIGRARGDLPAPFARSVNRPSSASSKRLVANSCRLFRGLALCVEELK